MKCSDDVLDALMNLLIMDAFSRPPFSSYIHSSTADLVVRPLDLSIAPYPNLSFTIKSSVVFIDCHS